MSVDGWNTFLVLGGIRSGKSAFAESLVDDAASVRYVATAVGGEDDPEWLARIEAHQRRRPQSWSTEETGADPERLAEVITDSKPDETLIVDDLGGWVATLLDPDRQPHDDEASVIALASAVRVCRARLVLVSPEVGLSMVATNPVGRAFVDALGTTNQALAAACDRVALVVAGRPVWLKGGQAGSTPPASTPAPALTPEPTAASPDPAAASPDPAAASPDSAAAEAALDATPASAALAAHAARLAAQQERAEAEQAGLTGLIPAPVDSLDGPDPLDRPDPLQEQAGPLDGPTVVLPVVTAEIEIHPGMDLPLPDNDSGPDAHDRLATLDLPGTGLGVLDQAVEFAASTQSTAAPRAWGPVRVFLLHGVHGGGAAAGADVEESARRAAQAAAGAGALARLAAQANADVQVIPTAPGGAMEDGPVLTPDAVEQALRQGWRLAERAADDGMDAMVIGSCGVGTEAATAAVLAATTGAEPVAVLGRVHVPGGYFDDASWMTRCAAVRDAVHRIRQSPRGAKDVLAEVAGADIAVATGVLLGAASRRVPVLIDGPVGISAALVARDLATQTRHWCLVTDHGNQPAVRQGADVLGLEPIFDLGLDLGEGANALAVLPLLRTAIGLATAVPVHPALAATHPDVLDHQADDSYVASFADTPADPAADTTSAAGPAGATPAAGDSAAGYAAPPAAGGAVADGAGDAATDRAGG